MIHVSLDLETWGTTPGSDIRSIGACIFAPDTGLTHDGSLGTIKPFYIATKNPKGYYGTGASRDRFFQSDRGWSRKYRLTRDASTVKWWSEQSEETQGAFADPVDLRDALGRFTHWLDSVRPFEEISGAREYVPLCLWSHGASFDPPILAAAYAAVNLPVPWHYRAPRDTRTLFDAAGIEDHSAWLDQYPGPLGIPHHALDDAICQARAVCAAMARAQQWRDDSDELQQMVNPNGVRDV